MHTNMINGDYIYSEEILENFNPIFEVTSCFIESEGKILLLLRQDHKPQPNTYGMPAGKIDNGETPLFATLREVQEETSISLNENNLEFIFKLYVKYPTYDYVYYVYKSVFESLPLIIINPKEHKNYLWISPTDALELDYIPGLDVCIKKAYF